MNEDNYKEVPAEFSLSQVRPRFHFDLPISAKDFVLKFKQGLKLENNPCKGEANEFYATLFFPSHMRHYWSPQLTLTVQKLDENSIHVRGLYGPRPPVWTMFMFFYITIGVSIFFILMIGGANLSLGQSSDILWLVPLLLAVFFSFYGVAYLGKKKSKPEIEVMHKTFLKMLDIQ
jgi:hypothetical protein